MKKFSEFPQAITLTDSDLLLISQYDGVSAYETKYITANLAESVSKREFIAKIDQAGITAPNITVIKDDFGDTYATVINAQGDYEITGFNGDLSGDEEIYINTNHIPLTYFVQTLHLGANAIGILTSDITGVLQNDVLVYPIYVRVTKYL